MNKVQLMFTVLIFVIPAQLAFAQRQTMRSIKRDTVLKGDTIKIFLTDTNFLTGDYDMHYKKNDDLVSYFRHYEDKNISPPGDYLNPQYIAFEKKAKIYGKLALESLGKSLRISSSLRRAYRMRDNDTSEVKSYSLSQIPIYRISPNIVNYENGQNLTGYYTLDTAEILYQIKFNNKIIGCTYFKNGDTHYAHFSEADSVSTRILELNHQKPIAFNNYLKLDNSVSSLKLTYGYIAKHGHIVFVIHEIGATATVIDESKHIKKVYTEHSGEMVTAEAYFASGGTKITRLVALINSTYKKYNTTK